MTEKKAALAAYRQRKDFMGVYAVTSTAEGRIWLGACPNPEAIRNRLWFTLQHGVHRNAALQSAWNRHGAAGFAFEVLEREETEPLPYVRQARLKERLAFWVERLSQPESPKGPLDVEVI